MKTLILLVILFITITKAKSQEAFVLGKTYRQGWVVWYPTNSPANLYKSKPISLVAKKTPNQDPANWEKMPDPTAPAPTYVKQSSFDSLLVQLKAAQAKQDIVEAKANLLEAAMRSVALNLNGLQKYSGFVDSLLNDVKTLKQASGTLRISQTALPLMQVGSDGVIQMRSIRMGPTSGLEAKVVNGEIVIDKK